MNAVSGSCPICSKYFVAKDIKIVCSGSCGRIFHSSCAQLSPKEYDRVVKGNGKWICGRFDCISNMSSNSSEPDVLVRITEIMKKVDEIKRDQNDFKAVLKYMYSGFERMKYDINLIQGDPTKCNVNSHLHPLLTGREKELAVKQLTLTGWMVLNDKDALYKEFTFKDFTEAFGFMTRVALVAEKIGHHPDWTNIYNKVQVTLISHDVNGITGRDIKLASYFDLFASGNNNTRSKDKDSREAIDSV